MFIEKDLETTRPKSYVRQKMPSASANIDYPPKNLRRKI